jgi:hypothetical protein
MYQGNLFKHQDTASLRSGPGSKEQALEVDRKVRRKLSKLTSKKANHSIPSFIILFYFCYHD